TTPISGECSSAASGSRGTVYELAPTASGRLTVDLSPSETFDGVLYVVPESCAMGDVSACMQGKGPGQPEQIGFAVAAGKKYYVFVEGRNQTAGPYTIRFTLSNAPQCGNNNVDPGEDCDTGGAPGTGCDATCHVTVDAVGGDQCPGV